LSATLESMCACGPAGTSILLVEDDEEIAGL